MAIRWISLGGIQPGIEAEQRRAIGAHARRLHREVDVWMIMRRQHADAVEFVNADANLWRHKLVVKFKHVRAYTCLPVDTPKRLANGAKA
jgi:hypothetical protein